MTENSNTNQSKELLFTEAPTSLNTRYVDPNGYECQITLRAVMRSGAAGKGQRRNCLSNGKRL